MILLIRDKTLNQIVERILRTVTLICLKGHEMLDPQTQAALDALAAAVSEETTVAGSVNTLLDGQAAQIEQLKNGVTDPAVLAAISAAVEIVKANNASMAAHVVSNTPAAGNAGNAMAASSGDGASSPEPVAEAPVTSSGTDAPSGAGETSGAGQTLS